MELTRCLAAIAVVGVLVGCSSTVTSSGTPSTTSTQTGVTSSSAEATTSDGDSSPSPSAPGATMSRTGEEQDYAQGKVKVLGEFTDHYGFQRLYLVVPAALSDDDLIALAKTIHEKEKKAWLWMLDDDSQGALMMEELSKAMDGSSGNYPLKWVEEHTVAHSKLLMMPKEDHRWVLYKGAYGDELVVLGTQKRLR